ncbi:methionine S-methyltransferase-like [Primulina eburnea]|uniref:methionine S-methyltransferase-like n=1 Tax=Primulina eburnea TaxID=1245227 RepID=UPI003C6C96DD
MKVYDGKFPVTQGQTKHKVKEDWSFTFFEGLNRHPDSILKYKTVTEIGCGNGWISIAIAEKWSHQKGFPSSVTPDYAPFQLWDSLQGLSTYMRTMLSTQDMTNSNSNSYIMD